MLPPALVACSLNVDRAAIRRYADVTQDYNPIHLDPDFAAQTPMRGIIAHGMLSLSLVWQSLAVTFGADALGGVTLDIRFVRPVREGDRVTAGGERHDGADVYTVWVRAEAENRAETVIEGTATMGAPLDAA